MFPSSNFQSKGASGSSNVSKAFNKPVVNEVAKAKVNDSFKCYNCQEVGHKSNECPKPKKRTMIAEVEGEDVGEGYSSPVEEDEQDIASGNEGCNLMMRRSCLTPK